MFLNSRLRTQLLRGMLKPIATFCVRRSIGLPEILEQLKRELVNASLLEIRKQQGRDSVSTVSAMTGITRREINRIVAQSEPPELPPNMSGRVLIQWSNDRRYRGKSGKPRVLTFGHDKSEFSTLVRSVSKDASPAAVLFELKRLGAVREGVRGVQLIQQDLFYRSDPVKAAGLMMRNIESLVAAAEENLDPAQVTRNLFMRTEFDHLSLGEIQEIRGWILERGMEFHEQLRTYLAKHDRDLNPLLSPVPDGQRRKIVIGSFSLVSESVENGSFLIGG